MKWECKPTYIGVVWYWGALETAGVTSSACVKLIFMVCDREIKVGLTFLWSKQTESYEFCKQWVRKLLVLTAQLLTVSKWSLWQCSSLCAAAIAARRLGPIGGSKWAVAGQVKCITSAGLKFGSVVGTQLEPSSPRVVGMSMQHPYCDDHRLECCAVYQNDWTQVILAW